MTNRKSQWNSFLSTKRVGGNHDTVYDNGRSAYQRDRDAIVFAESFRRLEGKTQVFSLARNDYVRNRLTHSMEVATVGRNIAEIIGQRLIEKYELAMTPHDFGVIIEAACLAHDIGHPPLAHAGEEAIREYFNGHKETLGVRVGEAYTDFTNFEGNAHNIRIITDLEQSSRQGGLRLTSAVIGALTKYPRTSYCLDSKYKKFNFFHCDKYVLEELAINLGLEKCENGTEYVRSPLVYIVEAADDICYTLVDIEDAFHMEVISYEKAVSLLSSIYPLIEIKRDGMDEIDHIKHIRAKIIGRITTEIADIFLDNEDAIIDGNLKGDLLDYVSCSRELKNLKEFAGEYIYVSPVALEVRTAGYNIIEKLLTLFIDAAIDYLDNGENASSKSKSYLAFMDKKKRDRIYKADNAYCAVMAVTDYLASLTDNKTVDIYQQFLGASIPTR